MPTIKSGAQETGPFGLLPPTPPVLSGTLETENPVHDLEPTSSSPS